MKKGIALWVLILCIIIFFIFGFITGTLAGFSTAVSEMSGCEEIQCADIGITDSSVQMCEVCSENSGVKILRG